MVAVDKGRCAVDQVRRLAGEEARYDVVGKTAGKGRASAEVKHANVNIRVGVFEDVARILNHFEALAGVPVGGELDGYHLFAGGVPRRAALAPAAA